MDDPCDRPASSGLAAASAGGVDAACTSCWRRCRPPTTPRVYWSWAWGPDALQQFLAVDVRLVKQFATQAGLVLQLTRTRTQDDSWASLAERRRTGRRLHDTAIQRLFALGLSLETTARMAFDQPAVAARVTTALADLDAVVTEIRCTILAWSASPDP